MHRETINPDSIETGPQPAAGSFEHSKRKLLAKAGAVIGALSLAATMVPFKSETAQARSNYTNGPRTTHPLEYVGVTSDQIWVPNLAEAQQAAQEIAATGANTVRIFEPLGPTQAEINNDAERLCNAAEAARENNLTLEVSFIGHTGDGGPYVPDSSNAVSRFLTTANAIQWHLAGPNADKPGSNGAAACVQAPLKTLIIEPFNEVNSGDFNNNQDPAKKYAYLMSRAYPSLNADAAKINQELSASTDPVIKAPYRLIMAAGGLAGSHNDPVGFLKNFDADLKALGVNSPPFDILAVHPYPIDPTTDPAIVESNLYPPLENELKSSFGHDVPIFYDEIGVPAKPAANKVSLYGPRSLAAAAVSEGLQAQFYHDALLEAATEPDVVGELIFQGRDDPNDGWPSGLNYPDGSHKGSWNSTSLSIHEAKDGTISN